MINFTSTNETIEAYAIILEGYATVHGYVVQERIFDFYNKLGHCKSALKSNKGLRGWNGKEYGLLPYRIEKVKVTVEKIEDVEIGE